MKWPNRSEIREREREREKKDLCRISAYVTSLVFPVVVSYSEREREREREIRARENILGSIERISATRIFLLPPSTSCPSGSRRDSVRKKLSLATLKSVISNLCRGYSSILTPVLSSPSSPLRRALPKYPRAKRARGCWKIE